MKGISLEILLSISCSPAHLSLHPLADAICSNICCMGSVSPGLDHTSFSRTEKLLWLEVGVLTPAFHWKTDHHWSKYKLLYLEMLCSALLWESLQLLHTMKRVVEGWQWQHYNDPSPRSAMAGFLVLMCTKEGKKQRSQESRVHLQVRLNLIEVKNLFLISQIPFSPCIKHSVQSIHYRHISFVACKIKDCLFTDNLVHKTHPL